MILAINCPKKQNLIIDLSQGFDQKLESVNKSGVLISKWICIGTWDSNWSLYRYGDTDEVYPVT